MADDAIAMFELAVVNEDVKIMEERHYKLVPASEIGLADLAVPLGWPLRQLDRARQAICVGTTAGERRIPMSD